MPLGVEQFIVALIVGSIWFAYKWASHFESQAIEEKMKLLEEREGLVRKMVDITSATFEPRPEGSKPPRKSDMVKVPTRNEAYCDMYPGDPDCIAMSHTGKPTTPPPFPKAARSEAIYGNARALPARNCLPGFLEGTGDGTAASNKGIPDRPPSKLIGTEMRFSDKPPAMPSRTSLRFTTNGNTRMVVAPDAADPKLIVTVLR